MLQFFEWYYPANGSLWDHFKNDAARLKEIGIDTVWLPPAQKSMGGDKTNGYDSYDIYDLGEFDQKGSVRTKYGTKEQLIDAVKTAQAAGLQVYADIVLNHMGGADEKENVTVRKVDPENRTEFISEPYEIEAYTKFTFPGRKGKYSEFIWDHNCFAGVDYDDRTKETAIFNILHPDTEGWQDVLSDEHGNYDFLMLADIDFRNPAVREEMKRWGKWLLDTVGYDGFRLDAIKHMDPGFYNEWLDHLRAETGRELFTVGEYWAQTDVSSLIKYIEITGRRMSLFDAPLQRNFHLASNEGAEYDLTTIFNGSLVETDPELAVTLVENHDTQPLQSLEQPVEAWFRTIAYALIMLREAGYPCIFYTDLYGSTYTDEGHDGEDQKVTLEKVPEMETLLWARKHLAYGQQRDYFDNPNCIGWTREGDDKHEGSGCAVLISNADEAAKAMEVGAKFAGQVFTDHLGKVADEITIDENGWAEFKVQGGSVSVWAVKREG
ncbi:alpha-amylase [Mucilaginibacter myungsuensis]|uniref:Alpha-amylase n=1 Tax=Mucilaginibacter myungsuensis TaxID=649104 RepID=A0A929L3N7_9SPHI|nr:alpha-amylase [Mucilaginibacter myungsuensis]MBE9662641.1 alpha-amylase [Mucilaginibacter myungsuensis]MDN3598061.1 alpha-amylase [Mucilaginibacter myungsuensis]